MEVKTQIKVNIPSEVNSPTGADSLEEANGRAEAFTPAGVNATAVEANPGGAAVSMTGFGVGRAEGSAYAFVVELKSVNHRFLEINVHVPREWSALEERVKKIIRRAARRGHVDVYIHVRPAQKNTKKVKLDKDLALEYDSRLKELAALLASSYRSDIAYLASCPDVLTAEMPDVDCETVWPLLEEAVNQAVRQFSGMRTAEGRALTQDLLGKIQEMKACVAVIAERAPAVVDANRVRLGQKLKQFMGDDPLLSDSRIAQELVLTADRLSIEEEVIRLQSHIDQFGGALQSGEAVGRKLDFLVQEMNRELNTIGAKAGDLLITQQVIQAKGLAENLKEQALNLE